MTTTTPTKGTHQPVKNPYAHTWTEAYSTLSKLMSQLDAVVHDIQTARHGLHWQGGSERYFQYQVGLRVYYLHQNGDYLETLRGLMTKAQEAGSGVIPVAQGVSA